MTHLKLGEILIRQGLITEKQLQEAIVAQKKEKGRIGEILVKLGMITEEHMAEALGTQMGIQHYSSKNLDLLKPQLDQELEKSVPAEFAKKHCVLPLSRHLNSMTCVVHDPLPSTTRWSHESVSDMRWPTTIVSFGPTTGFFTVAPTARIAAFGGLMIAEKRSTPIMPRFDTVNVPPVY